MRLALLLLLLSFSLHAQDITLLPVLNQNFRFKDIAGQAYAASYIAGFNYSNSSVVVTLDTPGNQYLSGRIVATGLKPNFAYQIKLEGQSTRENPNGDDATNERLGYMGRWWRSAPGSPWNATDAEYNANKNNPAYVFSGYLLMDFFVTNDQGAADVRFTGNNSFHVLWREDQRGRSVNVDGPARVNTLNPTAAPAYDVSLPTRSPSLYGEYEPTRALPGTLQMPLGNYVCNLGLTEESFHDSGPNAGSWAWAFKAWTQFDIKATPTVTWNNPAPVMENTPLGTQQLNAFASVPGTFTYRPPSNTLLPAGTHTLSVTFNPTDSASYVPVTQTVTFDVIARLPQTLTITAPTTRTYGDAPIPVQATSSALLPVSFYVHNGPAEIRDGKLYILGAGTVVLLAEQLGNATYLPETKTVSIVVQKAPLTLRADDKSRVAGAQNPVFTVTPTGLVNGDGLGALPNPIVFSTVAQPIAPAGVYAIVPSLPTPSSNYDLTYVDGLLTVTNNAPEFGSAGLAVFPNPARPAETVYFAAHATDADGHELIYRWDFGDGLSGASPMAPHVYSTPGTYRVTLTVYDRYGGLITAQTDVVIVTAAMTVTSELDTDGDGFSDALEFAMGSNPSVAADTPLGVNTGSAPGAMKLSSVTVSLDFQKPGVDAITLKGSFQLPEGTPLTIANGAQFGLDFGGVGRVFILRSSGLGFFDKHRMKAKIQRPKKGSPFATFSFQAQLKGNWVPTLEDEGLTNETNLDRVSRNLRVISVYNSHYFQTDAPVLYSVKAGRLGFAKLKR